MRLIATLKLILASAMDDPDFLPPSFAAFHSLVYTLADALAYATLATTTTTIPERPFSRHETEFDHIRSSIFELLDKLSNGQIVPLEGGQWNKYWTSFGTNLVPPSVARFVVVESLCRSLSAGAHTAGPDEARAKLILQELLPVSLPQYKSHSSCILNGAFSVIGKSRIPIPNVDTFLYYTVYRKLASIVETGVPD